MEEEKKGGSNALGYCLGIGCGVGALLLVGLVAVGFWGFGKLKQLGSETLATELQEAIRGASLPEEQKEPLVEQVERLKLAFQAGDVGFEQVVEFAEKLGDGPVFPAGAVIVAERALLAPAGLVGAELADAKLQLGRIARGAYEKDVDHDEVHAILRPIMKDGTSKVRVGTDEHTFESDWEFEEAPTPEEVRQVVENARAMADEKGIPAEPFEVDLAAEVRKAVDELLGEAPAGDLGDGEQAPPRIPEPGPEQAHEEG